MVAVVVFLVTLAQVVAVVSFPQVLVGVVPMVAQVAVLQGAQVAQVQVRQTVDSVAQEVQEPTLVVILVGVAQEVHRVMVGLQETPSMVEAVVVAPTVLLARIREVLLYSVAQVAQAITQVSAQTALLLAVAVVVEQQEALEETESVIS